MVVQLNGRNEDDRSKQIANYLGHVTEMIEAWVKKGDDPCEPVSRFATGREARANVTLAIEKDGVSDQEVFKAMECIMNNSVNPWTGRFVDKLYTAPLPLGIAAETLLASLNANAHVMSAAPMVCLAEETCISELAKLCSWDPDVADGLTMPGGSSSNTLAVQTALNTLYPSFQSEGLFGIISTHELKERHPRACRPLIFTAEEGHYSLEKAAIACGMGLSSVIKVPCDETGKMNVQALDELLTASFEDISATGKHPGIPFLVNATAGSTVMGAFDSLQDIADVCEKHRRNGKLWLHVDASWGGPILFSQKHRHQMRGVEHVDSLTINPHKLLNVPLQCSFALFRNGENLSHNALDAPYLFHTSSEDTQITIADQKTLLRERKLKRRENPAQMNFGCGRRGDALKFYLLWLSKGTNFFGTMVDIGIEHAEQIVQLIQTDSSLKERVHVSRFGHLFLQVCLRPTLLPGATSSEQNQATHYVHAELRRRQKFAVDFAPLGKGQGDFIRMVTHPSTPLSTLSELVHEIASIGDTLRNSSKNRSNGL